MYPPFSPTHMATDSRNEIFISRGPNKKNRNRNRINVTGSYLNPLMLNTPDASPNFITPRTSPAEVAITPRKVPVLYYLTRNGHIEHPHLVDVPLSSVDGLYLRDVMNALNYHRGKGMANMYSWSFKRSYKNGYVWHDLTKDDLIDVTTGHDYVLKGTELLQPLPPDTNRTGDNCSSTTTATVIRRRNQSWSSFDNPQEYMVVKCESNRELAANFAADAATQTEEQRKGHAAVAVTVTTEEMSSPPPSNSSSDGVTGGRCVDRMVEDGSGSRSGRMKASEMLMQLIACGAPSSRLKMQTGCG